MFFEVQVDTEDDRLTILALDCLATPSQDRNSEPRYDVIKDGCVYKTPLDIFSTVYSFCLPYLMLKKCHVLNRAMLDLGTIMCKQIQINRPNEKMAI